MTAAEKIENCYYKADATTFGPLARQLRELALSLGLKEELKWGSPNYTQKGNVLGILAFKKHLAIWFYQGALLSDPLQVLTAGGENTQAMRSWKIEDATKVDVEGIRAYFLEAMDNDLQGKKVALKKVVVSEADIPDELRRFLEENPMERAFFESLAPSHHREFVQYISEAKKEETRVRRMEKVADMLRNRMGLNDKYMK